MIYRFVDLKDYVGKFILKKDIIGAYKIGNVFAYPGEPGRKVCSWSIDENGEPLKEREGYVQDGDLILTKLNKDNVPAVDEYGHLNQWIISRKKFDERYKLLGGNIYTPIFKIQYFVRTKENITFYKGEEKMSLAKDGYINIDTLTCISKRDFEDTYQTLEDI